MIFPKACVAALTFAASVTAPAASDEIVSRYTQFDADKTCKHTPGRGEEYYGTWRCPGHAGMQVFLTAADQRMTVSFGRNARAAANELAAEQTLPSFNSVYRGVVEWRGEKLPDGRVRPFAAIMRWSYRQEGDERTSTGRMLVVTRLNPACHVGYVDARARDANVAARKIADDKARTFRCGINDAKAE